MKIFYGIYNNNIDITNICFKNAINNIITIPSKDHNRAHLFTDPVVGVLKSIFIVDNTIKEYNQNYTITINTINNEIIATDDTLFVKNKIDYLHSTLQLKYGNFNEELSEQKMAVRYLIGNEKVLEIGGNIGRNSLIIASIINPKNLVTLESDINIAEQLIENRNLNNLDFHIENAALSKRKLIQKGWDTMPSDTLQDGYNWINTISLDELNAKYNITFDTLVLDCEGSFYYILMDMPEILNNINLIIMENDYHDISHKQYIDTILKKDFYVEYSESGGWGCCYNNFFEVWKRNKCDVAYNIAFYTCFYGSNNNISFTIPTLPSLKYKCYYYTNNNTIIEQLKNTNWIGIYDEKPTNDDLIESCMAVKHVKTMPHKYQELKDYDYTCYMDNKMNNINETFIENFIATYFVKQNYALLLRQHPFIKDNIWNEYNESMKQKRYEIESEKYKKYITNQIVNGLSENTTQHCACGLLIRNMKHTNIVEINETWYQHIQECGIQDQLSFFFVKQLFNTIHPFSENPFL